VKIAYGIHGYGRGHAMRASSVLPMLSDRHELLILAGGDAYEALRAQFPIQRIPVLRYTYRRAGKLSNWRTAKRNLSLVLDVLLQGPTLDMVCEVLTAFEPDVVLTDSEIYTSRAARRLGLPLISFDNFGQIAYCRLEISSLLDRVLRWGNALGYRMLLGRPDRAIVASFFGAAPRRDGVRIVGPAMRPEVLRRQPTRGEHLLAYFSIAEHEYTPRVEEALQGAGCPVIVYGVSRQGRDGNIAYKPIANLPFLEDLASCRAVFGTTGNQLLGEVIYFRKPMLGMPINCLEQRLNAAQLSRLGIGRVVKQSQVSAALIRDFLAQEGAYAKNFQQAGPDGGRLAVEAIEQFAAELRPGLQSNVAEPRRA